MMANLHQIDQFIKGYSRLQEQVLSGAEDCLSELRLKGARAFSEDGITSVKNEEWKYTNVSALARRQFSVARGADLTAVDQLKAYLSGDDCNIVYVNGILSEELSAIDKLPQGITCLRLSHLKGSAAEKVAEISRRTTVNDSRAFLGMNQALHQDSLVFEVAPKTKVDQLVHVVYVSDGDLKDQMTLPHTTITVGQSAEASFLESFIGYSDSAYLTNAVTDVDIDENAIVHYCKAQNEGEKAWHVNSTRIWQRRNSRLESFTLTTSGELTRNNLSVILDGEGTESTINGLYTIKDKQHVDNHSLIDHRFPNCNSHQLYKGVLNDQSRAVFNGKIYVQAIAQKTNSYQLNKNLLLGTDCRIDTKPQLEIEADDVKCSHGATIGQINENELFYLQSRSIGKQEAIQMLSRGFIDDIIDTIPSRAIRDKLNQLLSANFMTLK